MTTRTASCNCGQLRAICEGEPVRISICHCLECQKRTGGVFGAQARFPREDVKIEGRATQWRRTGDSGGTATFDFCPVCGSTVCWTADGLPEFVTVAVGAFADPAFPPPHVSVYEERRHPWGAHGAGLAAGASGLGVYRSRNGSAENTPRISKLSEKKASSSMAAASLASSGRPSTSA